MAKLQRNNMDSSFRANDCRTCPLLRGTVWFSIFFLHSTVPSSNRESFPNSKKKSLQVLRTPASCHIKLLQHGSQVKETLIQEQAWDRPPSQHACDKVTQLRRCPCWNRRECFRGTQIRLRPGVGPLAY